MAKNQFQYYLAIIKHNDYPFHHATALCRRDTNTKQIKIEHTLSIRLKDEDRSTIFAPFMPTDAWVVEYENASEDKKSRLKASYPLSMITALAPLSAQAEREYTQFSQAYAYQYYKAALKLIPSNPLIKSDEILRPICKDKIKFLEGSTVNLSRNIEKKIEKTGAPRADCHRFTRAVFKSHTGFYQDQLKGGLPLSLLGDLTSRCKLNAVLASNGARDRREQAFKHFKRYTLPYFPESARNQFELPDFDVNTMSDDMLILLKSELSKLALKRHTLPPLFRFQSIPKELQAAIQGGCYEVDTSSVKSTVAPLLLSWAGVVLTVAVIALVAVAACSLMVSGNATSSLAVLKHFIIHSFEQAPGVGIGITAVSGVGSLVSSIGLLVGGGVLFGQQQQSLLALDITVPAASQSE